MKSCVSLLNILQSTELRIKPGGESYRVQGVESWSLSLSLHGERTLPSQELGQALRPQFPVQIPTHAGSSLTNHMERSLFFPVSLVWIASEII